MDEDQFKGKWEQMKGRVREEFGKLTDDDLQEIKGQRNRLLGKIQERYGDTKEKAAEKLKQFERKLK